MRLRNSFWAMLGRDISEAPDVVTERARKAMLLALDKHCSDNHHYALDIKINFAQDLTELWYLRPDLMNAIAASQDEAVAGQILASITDLFKGHFRTSGR